MASRYLLTLFATLSLLVAGTVAVTLHIDPFGIVGPQSSERLSRINQFWHMRLTKPVRLRYKHPEQVILGSSRSGRISPQALGLDRGFNASLPGTTLFEMQNMLGFAQDMGDLDMAIIGLDFDFFLNYRPQSRLGFNAALLGSEGDAVARIQLLVTLKQMFFSTLALGKAYEATHPRPIPGKAVYLDDGSWYREKDKYSLEDFVNMSRLKLADYHDVDALAPEYEDFSLLLERCHSQDINCVLLVTPVHLFHLDLLRQIGLLEMWRQWHRDILALNADIAGAHGRQPLPVWGFNNFDPAVAESMARREELASPWFRDNYHFRPRFGEVILRRLLEPDAPDMPGVLLTRDNLEDYLDQVEALRARVMAEEQDSRGAIYRALGLRPLPG